MVLWLSLSIFLWSATQVQVLYVSPLNHVKPSSYSGVSAKSPSMARSGLSCACVGVAKTRSTPLTEEQYVSRVSPGNSPLTESSLNTADIVSSRRRYSIKKDGTPQPPGEILSRVLRETPSHEIPSPLLYSCKVSEMLLVLSFVFRRLVAQFFTLICDV